MFFRILRKKFFFIYFITLCISFSENTYGFGKNKVQYSKLKWEFKKLPNINLYYHQNQNKLPNITAIWAEEIYSKLASDFGITTKQSIPLLVFASPLLFEQTNIINGIIPEGVGGFTEALKKRVVIPFNGDYSDYRHVLHHEMVHAFQYAVLYDKFGGSLLNNTTNKMPLWFAEGSAEYLSSEWDKNADMFMMDLVINGNVPLPGNSMNGYIVYKGGQSFLHYLNKSRGHKLFKNFLAEFVKTKNVEKSITEIYKIKLKDLGEDWIRELHRIYWPEIGIRENPDAKATEITSPQKYKSHFNLNPHISPDGSKIAFFSDVNDFTNIIITDTKGNKITTITQYGYGGFFESFQPFRSGLAWSPNSSQLAFITKNKGTNEIRIIDVNTRRIIRKIKTNLRLISSPDWSPDGNKIIFTGLKNDKRDIYEYYLTDNKLVQLTNSIKFESSPKYLKNGYEIIFSAKDTCGNTNAKLRSKVSNNLYLLNKKTKKIKQLTFTPWNELSPTVSASGKNIAFISDKNGISNIYIAQISELENAKPLTNFIGGCYTPDWASKDSSLVFTLFQKQKWNVWLIKNPTEKLIDSTLKPTAWVKSLSDTSKLFFSKINKKTDSTSDTTSNKLIHKKTLTFDKSILDTIKSNNYKIKFTPDAIAVGMAINTLYGYAGQGMMQLSDILGNHKITFAGNIQSSLDEYYIFASYTNLQHRLNFGISSYLSRFFTYTSTLSQSLYHDTNLGLTLNLSYPFSISSRMDFTLLYKDLKRIPYSIETNNFEDNNISKRVTVLPALSYSFDNILWGITGPINGIRAQTNFLISPIKENSFVAFEFDFRKYFHISKRFVWANRITAGISSSLNGKESSRKYFLGGNENWIFYKVNTDNYIKNLESSYYSDYITPLRGWNYYDLEGSKFALFNSEFRFPFIKDISIAWPMPIQIRYINGAFFIDAGNAWNPKDQYKNIPLPKKIYGGIGYGLRANLGIFVLRYDHAWKTDWSNYMINPKDYFSLGAEF